MPAAATGARIALKIRSSGNTLIANTTRHVVAVGYRGDVPLWTVTGGQELFEEVNATVRYAKSPTAIGVVKHGDRAILVDTGLDENLVRKVINALANEGATVVGIVNTHAHADHIGGNAFAKKRTGATLVAPEFEHYFVERPELEPYTLFGAPAPSSMRGKFLQAAPSHVDVAATPGELTVAGFDVKLHDLGGHSVRQMGVEVDGVLFAGDALLPDSIIRKYGLVFAVDPLQARESSRRVAAAVGLQVVSYHGGLLDDVAGAVRANEEAISRAQERLLARLAREPATTDDLVVELLDAFGGGATLELHALHSATVRGYLSALERVGRVEAFLDAMSLKWKLRI